MLCILNQLFPLFFFSEKILIFMLQVTGVQDDPSSTSGRLSAVQILRIEPDGRVGMDGRLKVGDNIIEIDSRPVYQVCRLLLLGNDHIYGLDCFLD